MSELNGFSVIDFAGQMEATRVTLPKVPQEFDHGGYRTNEPSHGIGIAPDNKTLWVTSIPNNAVYGVFARRPQNNRQGRSAERKRSPAATRRFPRFANWVTFTPDGKELYISNSGMRSVSVVDTGGDEGRQGGSVGEVPKRNNTLVIPDDNGHANTPVPDKRASAQ